MNARPSVLTAMIILSIGFYVLGRTTAINHQMPQDGVVVRWEDTGWIEVWRAGDIRSEWGKRDGFIYCCLRALLDSEWNLLINVPDHEKPDIMQLVLRHVLERNASGS